MTVVLVCISFFILYGVIEYAVHIHYASKIPIRIHVNGTRGKSSVTRLIASGLNAAGLKTFAKTTGSAARLIFPDGTEQVVSRSGPANILEQMRVIRQVARHKPDVLVMECMAIRANLQKISSQKLVRASLAVITRVGPDHLDSMGPTEKDVALALAQTIPQKGDLFTTEKKFLSLFSEIAGKKKARVHPVHFQEDDFSGIRKALPYIEHAENIALALAVCSFLGTDTPTALNGMKKTQPDIGALQEGHIAIDGKSVTFINAFAANDPASIASIWSRYRKNVSTRTKTLIIINLRPDRPHRTKQLAKLPGDELQADFYLVAGEPYPAFRKIAVRAGAPMERILRLQEPCVNGVIKSLKKIDADRIMIMGIGNMAGAGIQIINFFQRFPEPNSSD